MPSMGVDGRRWALLNKSEIGFKVHPFPDSSWIFTNAGISR
jgi:hypothetical protein